MRVKLSNEGAFDVFTKRTPLISKYWPDGGERNERIYHLIYTNAPRDTYHTAYGSCIYTKLTAFLLLRNDDAS